MQIDNVNEFVYLGSLLTWDSDCSKEIKRKLAKAMGQWMALALSGRAHTIR